MLSFTERQLQSLANVIQFWQHDPLDIVSPLTTAQNRTTFFVKMSPNDFQQIAVIMDHFGAGSVEMAESAFCELRFDGIKLIRKLPKHRQTECKLIYPKSMMTVRRRAYRPDQQQRDILRCTDLLPFHHRTYFFRIQCCSISICHRVLRSHSLSLF